MKTKAQLSRPISFYLEDFKRLKVLVKEVNDYSITVTGFKVPKRCKPRALYFRPDTRPCKYNRITDCLITPEYQIIYLESPTKDYTFHKHVTVELSYETWLKEG